MLRHGRRTVIGMSLLGLLLLAPAVSRADPITLIGFVQLGKHLSDPSSLTAKLPSFPQFLGQSNRPDRVVDTHVAQTWWQGDPEVLDALFSGQRLDSNKEVAATHDYLAARIYDFAGDKEAASFMYRQVHEMNEGCAYWDTATTRMRELEAENQASYGPGGMVSWQWECRTLQLPPTPEVQALTETYERACSPQRLWQRPVGSQHPITTPAEEATKENDAAKISMQSYGIWD
jgi:hypothetical protein